jgi:hypothetical protein
MEIDQRINELQKLVENQTGRKMSAINKPNKRMNKMYVAIIAIPILLVIILCLSRPKIVLIEDDKGEKKISMKWVIFYSFILPACALGSFIGYRMYKNYPSSTGPFFI